MTVHGFHPLGANHTSTHKWRGGEKYTPSHIKTEKVLNAHMEREISTCVHTHGEGQSNTHAHVHRGRGKSTQKWKGRVAHTHLSGFTHTHIRCFVVTFHPVICAGRVRVELTTQEIVAAQDIVPGHWLQWCREMIVYIVMKLSCYKTKRRGSL